MSTVFAFIRLQLSFVEDVAKLTHPLGQISFIDLSYKPQHLFSVDLHFRARTPAVLDEVVVTGSRALTVQIPGD